MTASKPSRNFKPGWIERQACGMLDINECLQIDQVSNWSHRTPPPHQSSTFHGKGAIASIAKWKRKWLFHVNNEQRNLFGFWFLVSASEAACQTCCCSLVFFFFLLCSNLTFATTINWSIISRLSTWLPIIPCCSYLWESTARQIRTFVLLIGMAHEGKMRDRPVYQQVYCSLFMT